MHLIVLDDEARIAGFIAAIARDIGWSVETFAEGDGFQESCRRRPPDLVMLDLQLSLSDGVEQLHFLHGQGYRGQVILVSGFDRRVLTAAEQIGTSLGLAIAAVLQKPARAAEVRRLLETAAAQVRASPPPASAGIEETVPKEALSGARITAADVGRAIEEGAMRLHLQPVVAAASGTVSRFEALIRWRHPRFGTILPGGFVAIAEEDETVIDRLTLWVLRSAVAQYKALAAQRAPLPISVNISGANLRGLDFPDRVAAIVEECGASPSAIAFEVTESIAMRDTRATIDILTRLRLKGFALAMDDFGTGFSSLSALLEMPFSELKIDKSFVLNMPASRDSFVIVKSVIDLARNMGIDSVAEGVETAETMQMLTDLGASGLQGYYYSPPLAPEFVGDWLAARDRANFD